MISQHWLRWWLGAVRQQAKTWANVDPDICRHLASLDHNELNIERELTGHAKNLSLTHIGSNIKGRLKSIAWSTSVRCMELHDRKWCVEASNLKISVLPIVTWYVTIDTTHGCLGLIRQPHPRVIVMTGRASLVRECKQMTEWSSSGSSCGCRAVSGIPIPNSHHQVH